VFENVLGQAAAVRLAEDLRSDTLPPALLFSGPPASGKGSAALELGRALSCAQGDAVWNCTCPACSLHRTLTHPDLLMLGSHSFAAEIGAAGAAFLREPESAARLLFLRALGKLLGRFSSVLWEGEEAKLGKISPLILTLNEGIDELTGKADAKTVQALMHAAYKLEAEGLGETIPIAQIRRAAYWARLAPTGRRKLLLIENADRMQEGARNALLKIMEEPPRTTVIVLTTAHRGALLPTVLSRLRPYTFIARDAATEREVIRRVFRDASPPEEMPETGLVSAYLESFLPVPPRVLAATAAFFMASAVAAGIAPATSKTAGPKAAAPSALLVALGRQAAALAETGDMGRPERDQRSVVAAVLRSADNFNSPALFPVFLDRMLRLSGFALRDAAFGPDAAVLADAWRLAVARAAAAVGTYNQSPALALERLFSEIAAGCAG